MKRDLDITIYKITKTLNLRKHNKKFEFKTCSGGIVVFDWDGAARDKEDSFILFESELGQNFVVSHIQAHIARLYVMMQVGVPVQKLVWIIYPSCYKIFSRIVTSWLELFWDKKVPCVEMEYRDQEGRMLSTN